MTVDTSPAPVPNQPPELHPLHAPGRERLARAWSHRRAPFVGLIIGLIVLLFVASALADRVAFRNQVMPGVTVGHVSLGGLSEQEALAVLQAESDRLYATPVTIRAGDKTLSVDPSALGLVIDLPATVRSARKAGRSANPLNQLVGTILRRTRDDRVPLSITLNQHRVEGVMDAWVSETGKGLVDGGLAFEGSHVIEIAPKAGTGINRGEARGAVVAALTRGESDAGSIAIGHTTPAIDIKDLRDAARRARALLADPVVVTADGTDITLSPEQVARTLSTQILESNLALRSDPVKLRAELAPGLGPVETLPKDAGFSVSGSTVSVIPATTGSLANVDVVARQIGRGKHAVTAPIQKSEPARSTTWAEKLNITELVSSYTTNHPCCAQRVTNIHTASDALNNTIVEPGATFSLNGTLGPRTTERGYVAAPAIRADLEYEDAIGGGVSQISTTLYNATFFGCYEDVTHTVHALYISRYPMGREATLNFPSIDNKFRNDSNSGVLIRTSYSPTSITVSLYGNKEGRSCRAEGPNTLETLLAPVEYIDDPAMPVGTEKELAPGHEGYVVENFRVINRVGQPEKRQRFVERYAVTPRKIARGTGPAPVPVVPAVPPAPPA